MFPLLQLITTLRLNTKMNVPVDYETRFQKAEQTFLYQIVFDPKTNKLVPLNPVPDEIDPSHLHFAGQYPFYYIAFYANIIILPIPQILPNPLCLGRHHLRPTLLKRW